MNDCPALPVPLALPPVLTEPAAAEFRPRRRGRGWILPVFATAALGLLIFGVTGYFRLNPDARALRNTLLQATTGSAHSVSRNLEFHVGPLTCLALRSGLGQLRLEPKARAALETFRGGEVGVYHLPGGMARKESNRVRSAADAAMMQRGWEPLVEVAEGNQLVLIYVPADGLRGTTVRVCLAVLQRDQLVIGSATANLEPLAALGLSELKLPHSG